MADASPASQADGDRLTRPTDNLKHAIHFNTIAVLTTPSRCRPTPTARNATRQSTIHINLH